MSLWLGFIFMGKHALEARNTIFISFNNEHTLTKNRVVFKVYNSWHEMQAKKIIIRKTRLPTI